MNIKIGTDLKVRIDGEAVPVEAVSENNGARLLAVDADIKVSLPASEYPAAHKERREFIQSLRAGQVLEVRVIDYDDVANRWIVSRQARLRENPWADVVPGWEVGKTIQRFQITNVHADLAYGEILPDVAGWVDLAAVKEYFLERGQENGVPLVGDYLIGYVSSISQEKHLVGLDVAAYLRSIDLETAEDLEPLRPPEPDARASSEAHRDSVPVPPLRCILVLDDDRNYLEAIRRRLTEDGIIVKSADSPAAALRHLEKDGDDEGPGLPPPIEVALIDVNLTNAGLTQVGGIRIAQQIQRDRPDIRLLLMSGDVSAGEKLVWGNTEGLRVHGYLPKPFGPARLRNELSSVLTAQPAPPETFLHSSGLSVRLAPQRPQTPALLGVNDALKELARKVGAESATLFAIHPVSLLSRIIAGAHPPHQWHGRGWQNFWRQKLQQSPVRDVAIDHARILEIDATSSNSEPRHRWLQRAYGYRSCVGEPVTVAGEESYALFVFHSQADRFQETQQAHVQANAAQIGMLLEKERLLKALEAETRYVTSGITLNVLGHELRNTLGAAAFEVAELLDLITSVNAEPEAAGRSALAISEALDRSVGICEMFLEHAKSNATKHLSVEECVERAIRFTIPGTDLTMMRVVIDEIDPNLYILAERIAIEQVLFNLLLNAAEQVRLFGRTNGRIEVSAQPVNDKTGRKVRIIVKDNGPGIHFCWWEKIFTAGFSTKPTGSGLGLHVCRRTLERLHGSIRVLRSDLGAGTAFVITLPAVDPPQ